MSEPKIIWQPGFTPKSIPLSEILANMDQENAGPDAPPPPIHDINQDGRPAVQDLDPRTVSKHQWSKK